MAGGDEFEGTVTDVVTGETVRTPERSAPRARSTRNGLAPGLAAASPRWTEPTEAKAPPI